MEFTDEQINLFRSALDKVARDMPEHNRTDEHEYFINAVIAELQPKPRFAEGQVVAYIELENDFPNQEWTDCGNLTPIGLESARELNQTEVGPNWIPNDIGLVPANDYDDLLAEFEELRDGIADSLKKPWRGTCQPMCLQSLLDSLPDHLKGGE